MTAPDVLSLTLGLDRNRIVLADDSVLLRTGVQRMLLDDGFDVVAAVGDATALVDAVERLRPDAAIIDIRMPPDFTDEGLRAAEYLRRSYPQLAIMLLSQYVETRDVLQLLGSVGRAGVGYLLKDRITDIDMFIADVRRVVGGGTAVDPVVFERLARRPRVSNSPMSRLSPREREILSLMAEGRSNAAIAARLFLVEKTVESHVSRIFDKLDLSPMPDDNRRVLAVLTLLREK